MSAAPGADLRARLQLAHDILDQTDLIALDVFHSEPRVHAKPDRTLVTDADTSIERLIRDRLADACPADGVLGEELGGADETDATGRLEARWIVDPIDATHNFVRRIGVFATLLAFERGGRLELGLISAPALGQRWYAARGAGAFLREGGRERPIRVSGIGRLDEAHVLHGSLGLSPVADAGLRGLARDAWRNRGFGDFWGHMLVASGSAEIMVETDLMPWDLAAPAIILEESGGRLTNFAGVATWRGPEAVSTNGLLHEVVLARLRHG
ncbi:histidinol-phosphatase [soil metagenome]